jgi:16S rRNA (cytidine1402-2'-O)-methyltransferase
MEPTGKLYLIPNLLGDSDMNLSITPGVKEIVNQLRHFIVENEKTARRHLRAIGFEQPFDDVELYPIGKHSDPTQFGSYLKVTNSGQHMGVFSEAGLPGIADPGAEIIRIAHQRNIKVVPLTGPSSIIMALITSGMNGQQFSFHGYIPKEKGDRIKKLHTMEKAVVSFGSQIFMETPFRNNQLLEDILNHCSPNTELCIATDITLETESIQTRALKDWKSAKLDLSKRPTVFVFG